MRSTLTIDDHTDKSLRLLAEREHLSYKDAVNLALAKGLDQILVSEAAVRYRVKPFNAGFQAGIDQGKLNGLAEELGDEP